MAEIKIDKISRWQFIVVDTAKFFTRRVQVDDAVAKNLIEFYEKQVAVEQWLKDLYESVEGHRPVPETPEFLKEKKRAKTTSKQRQSSSKEESQE